MKIFSDVFHKPRNITRAFTLYTVEGGLMCKIAFVEWQPKLSYKLDSEMKILMREHFHSTAYWWCWLLEIQDIWM